MNLLSAKTLPDEVIVVDQTDANLGAKEIESICEKYEIIRYIHTDIPSLTRARNIGLKNANGNIIVFMDDDVDVKDDTFKNIDNLMSDNSVSMIGGFDENSNYGQSIIYSFWGRSSFLKRKFGHVTHAVYGQFPNKMPTKNVKSQWAMGFFFVIRKDFSEAWDLKFDEKLKFYGYAEDLDFTYRYYLKSQQNGLKCIMSPLLTVRHNVSKEFRLPLLKTYCMAYAHRWYLGYKFWGIMSVPSILWSNMGDLIISLIYRLPNRRILVKANKFLFRHHYDIKNGEFHYEEFM